MFVMFLWSRGTTFREGRRSQRSYWNLPPTFSWEGFDVFQQQIAILILILRETMKVASERDAKSDDESDANKKIWSRSSFVTWHQRILTSQPFWCSLFSDTLPDFDFYNEILISTWLFSPALTLAFLSPLTSRDEGNKPILFNFWILSKKSSPNHWWLYLLNMSS